jgi:transcriptional regulator with XRE-family HTH domain
VSALRSYRERNGLSQADLGGKVGVSAAQICRIEKGLRNPSMDLGRRLVAATGGEVSLDQLAGGAPGAEEAAA